MPVVPDLIGMSVAIADNTLRAAGLRRGLVKRNRTNEVVEPSASHVVVRSEPDKDADLEPDSAVDLIVETPRGCEEEVGEG